MELVHLTMLKKLLGFFIGCIPAICLSQIAEKRDSLPFYGNNSFTIVIDSSYSAAPRFLALDAKLHQLNPSTSAAFQKERSLMRYDLKSVQEEPSIILGDLNLFEMRYRKTNTAYYEALKNTAYMQVVNPFSCYQPL